MAPRNPSSQADSERAIGLIAREGVVDSVDLDAGKVVVALGDGLTPPIDWMMATGDTSIWIPPTKGQQVSVITPEGDVERAYVIGGLPSSEMAPLFLGLKNAVRFKDESIISYDPEESALLVDLKGGMKILAPNGLDIEGDVTIKGDTEIDGEAKITGDVKVDKTLEASTDVIGAGKSLKGHKHLGVQTGAGVSGAPQ